ncbi:MAG: molybdate ABC transporter substrate-binding protein [Gaiellales bacterium]|nr:molybdate ABC transporter substrate-binding protein [Gaiellales bacterium]
MINGRDRTTLPIGLLAIILLLSLCLAGCGSTTTTAAATTTAAPTTTAEPSTTTTAAAATTCNVFAAASLSKAFPDIQTAFKKANPQYANVEFVNNFQGTDALVAQIEQGAPADVFAAASTKYGKQLADKGLTEAPLNFCQNKLIVILPANNPGGITSLEDLVASGKKIAIGSETVPVGTYTRTVLKNLSASFGADYTDKIMANVVTQAEKVTAITSSVTLGEVDAGFVYVTDATAAKDKVTVLDIPNEFQSDPLPTYPIAVVKTNQSGEVAQAFIDFVLGDEGQKILQRYDFLPKP